MHSCVVTQVIGMVSCTLKGHLISPRVKKISLCWRKIRSRRVIVSYFSEQGVTTLQTLSGVPKVRGHLAFMSFFATNLAPFLKKTTFLFIHKGKISTCLQLKKKITIPSEHWTLAYDSTTFRGLTTTFWGTWLKLKIPCIQFDNLVATLQIKIVMKLWIHTEKYRYVCLSDP